MNTVKKQKLLRNVLLSSTLLLAFIPEENVSAQDMDYTDQKIDEENHSLKEWESISRNIVDSDEELNSISEVSFHHLFEHAISLHKHDKFEEANKIYTYLYLNIELTDESKRQLADLTDEVVLDEESIRHLLSDEDLSLLQSSLLADVVSLSPLSNDESENDTTVNFEDESELIVEDDSTGQIELDVDLEANSEKVMTKTGKNVSLESDKTDQKITDSVNVMMTSSVNNQANTLYQETTSAYTASEAWSKAVEGYTTYPNDSRFKEAIEVAAERMMTWAKTLESRERYNGAIDFYETVLSSPWLPNHTKQQANILKEQATADEATFNNRIKATKLFEESMEARTASEAWSKAVEGYTTYPNDSRFKEAIIVASDRMITWANTLESRENYGSAVEFYDTLLASIWLPNQTTQTVEGYKYRAENHLEQQSILKLYRESIKSPTASGAWSKAIEGYSLYPTENKMKEAIEVAAGRMISWAGTLESRGNYDASLEYFETILTSPWLSNDTRAAAKAGSTKMIKKIDRERMQTLYNESITSPTASGAWEKALEGYSAYPSESLFKDAIENAASRVMKWAKTLESRGDYASALHFYKTVQASPWLLNATKSTLENDIKRVNSAIDLSNRLYSESMTAATASESWSKALDGYDRFSKDGRFEEAIGQASERMIEWAKTLESRGNYSGAIDFYTMVLSSTWLPTGVKQNVSNLKSKTEEILKSADFIYNESINAQTALIAWNKALEGLNMHNQDDRFEEALFIAASRVLEEAMSAHRKADYTQAIENYARLIDGPARLSEIKVIAEKYSVLAQNKLTINSATYQTSNFTSSLENALNEQMKRAPQTDVDRKWVNASPTQVEYYLNPENFLNGMHLSNNSIIGHVNASALNVRSGSGTTHNPVDKIYQGQEVEVTESRNGWLNVTYVKDNSKVSGWVSGKYITPVKKQELTKEFTNAYYPTAQVDVAVLNVRSGPGISYNILTTINLNSRYTVLAERNGWYQVQLSGNQTGWVSGDLVTVTNRIDRNLLQFLKLSSPSSIGVVELNEELINSGILKDTGSAFIEASERFNINEIYLMAHAKLETGNGTSRLATGVMVSEVDGEAVEPKFVYNMYGIAAYDNSPLKSGSEYAYKMGWDTVEKSIIGGAEWISRQYVNHATHKQDTLYKMRWNPSNPGAHQYATDIGWAVKQTSSLNTLVELSQRHNLTLQFDIPVYNNSK